jgi:hypothetical protein
MVFEIQKNKKEKEFEIGEKLLLAIAEIDRLKKDNALLLECVSKYSNKESWVGTNLYTGVITLLGYRQNVFLCVEGQTAGYELAQDCLSKLNNRHEVTDEKRGEI